MISLEELTAYCNRLLGSDDIDDYCPNGLQVSSGRPVRRIVTGVTACLALLEAACEYRADVVLVHHGYFWRNDPATLVGMRYNRIRALIQADIGLLAYHLPLDCHREFGNNVQLARRMGWIVRGSQVAMGSADLFWFGELSETVSAQQFAEHIGRVLDRQPLLVGPPNQSVRRIGWCTGGAQQLIGMAQEQKLDAFVSGEISEQTTHAAREGGIAYVAAGHHATERYGVQALGEHLASQFNLDVCFIDIDNPV